MSLDKSGFEGKTKLASLALLFFCFIGFSKADFSRKIGVNYGRLGDSLPSPYNSIEIIKSMKAGSIKLYDANPAILKLLAGTKMYVSVMVANEEIVHIAANQRVADEWVRINVLRYYPDTRIRLILVGNEVTSSVKDKSLWSKLVPAMRRIKNSLTVQGIRNIKVSTPFAMDVLTNTYPPSNATFCSDVLDTVMVPLLKFLNGTKSYFSIDVYPYFPWSADPTNISLPFALFQSEARYTDPGSGFVYTNLLDQMLDSVVFAMTKLGYPNIRLLIAETGWPNSGDIDQPGANIYNAATYNRNLIKKLTRETRIGTPARPGEPIPTFLFSLYDENQKPGAGTERHWGMVLPDGKPIYEIDLAGNQPTSMYAPLPTPQNNTPYKGKLWCVPVKEANLTALEAALIYACNQGNSTCEALTPGKGCYEPVSIVHHARYAFSSYWAQLRSQGAACYFNGLATQTTRNPSHGSCMFPSVTL